MRFTVRTTASPAQVRRALTDFSDRRLQIWDRSLDPGTYEVREVGETWAVARESTPRSPFWVVCHYDWSDPDVVTWQITESSYGGGGQGAVRAAPLDGGGSLVQVEWNHTDPLRQKGLLFLMRHSPMHVLVSRLWTSALDRYADDDTS